MSETHPPDFHVDARCADLPPAATLVYVVLQLAGPCSQAEIRTRAALADGTARAALEDLQDAGLVDKQPSTDGRSPRYRIRRD